ncbi:MAG: hypothetical protein LBV28_00890, partial [Puniceicoccales bacterium]|nr:hypothetical protein [Puniceicoccales bacterium]
MKSIITISSVVFASAAAIALIGCKTESGFEDQNTGANGTPYYGGAVGRSQPAQNDHTPAG